MCGRYTETAGAAALARRFGIAETSLELAPRYNLAPSQQAPVVAGAPRALAMMRWGLVPRWAKEPKIGYKMINARAEGLASSPAFREAYRARRCLVPADGFYEWHGEKGAKVPLRYTLKDGGLFAFAGLWESRRDPAGKELRTFTIVTTASNELIRPMHDRMPVILGREAEDIWLDPSVREPARLAPLLRPFPSDAMAVRQASPAVNSARIDEPELLLL